MQWRRRIDSSEIGTGHRARTSERVYSPDESGYTVIKNMNEARVKGAKHRMPLGLRHRAIARKRFLQRSET